MGRNRFSFCRLMVLLLLASPLLYTVRASAQALPADSVAVNVKNFGAKGDGITDDTEAIKAAIAKLYAAWEQIYLPAGTYLISDSIDIGRFETLRGDGPDKTILKLKDGAPGYGDKTKPKWVLRSYRGCCDETSNDNQTHSVHILNLAVDVGSNNPGAVGIDFIAHNGGGIENVVLRAPEGSGLRGISLLRNSPGPALFNRITVDGFDVGIAVRWGFYATVMEDIELRNQKTVGLTSDGHPLSLRHLVSQNSVLAVKNTTKDYGMLVLLDSALNGGTAKAAIESEGAIYLRSVCTTGYETALNDGGKPIAGASVVEYASSEVQGKTTSPQRTLNLPVRDMYVPTWDPPSEWVSVRKYESLVKDGDWTPAIQAAIDEGKSTVYFPNYTNPYYKAQSAIHVRGALRRIIGLSASIVGAKLVVEIDDPKETVYIEQLRDVALEHVSKATVVLRRSLGQEVRTSKGAGDLFVDDWCCGNFSVNGSSVWVRQLNEESTVEKLQNNGGKLWVLGLKTEQFGTVGHFTGGSSTEIFGGLIYAAQGAPKAPMYINEDSSFAAFHREGGNGYPVFAREIHGGKTEDENPTFTQGTLYVSDRGNLGSAPEAPSCSIGADTKGDQDAFGSTKPPAGEPKWKGCSYRPTSGMDRTPIAAMLSLLCGILLMRRRNRSR